MSQGSFESQVNGNIRICVGYKCSSAVCLKLLQESNLCVRMRSAGEPRGLRRGRDRGRCERSALAGGEAWVSPLGLLRFAVSEDLFRWCWPLCPSSALTFLLCVAQTWRSAAGGARDVVYRHLSSGGCESENGSCKVVKAGPHGGWASVEVP